MKKVYCRLLQSQNNKKLLLVMILLFINVISSQAVFIIKPYIQNPSKHSITICFQTEEMVPVEIYYGETPTYGYKVTSSKNSKFQITINDLNESTKYYYSIKIINKEYFNKDENFYFITSSDLSTYFNFTVIGDTLSAVNEENYHHKQNVAAMKEYSFPELILHTGDIVKNNQISSWKTFFDIEFPVVRAVPIYPVLGNFDPDFDEFSQYFIFPENLPYYSFSHKNTLFIALDIRGDVKNFEILSHDSVQFQWLLSTLSSIEAKSARYIVVYFHTPIFPANGNIQSELQSHLTKIFSKYRVDVVFNSGHYYSSTFYNNVWYVITGGGGAPLSDFNKKPSFVNNFFSQYHHLKAEVNESILTISVLSDSQVMLDNIHIYHSDKNEIYNEEDFEEYDGNISQTTFDRKTRETKEKLPLTVYYKPGCPYCNKLKKVILPKLVKLSDRQIITSYKKLETEEEWKEFLEIEKSLNDQGNNLPAIVFEGQIFSGKDEIESGLADTLSALNDNSGFNFMRIVFIISGVVILCIVILLISIAVIKKAND